MSSGAITRSTYYKVFIALLVLLALTISAAYFNFGIFNAYIALTIAVVKAILVILFFMHVRDSSRLTWVFVAAGFFWFFIMVVFTVSDFAARY